ncbi:oligosaccharide flippase family protein [Poseidonocella sp. HB161398]|uniref:oligosaccharide flippase family protein n=1 Tax=Poseidonocella sp. HB161398 TaxID=2320855 RepID=UPI00148703A0|nr:oligosaccharide flippase family protein [Poseidonocella sp. HB161398]
MARDFLANVFSLSGSRLVVVLSQLLVLPVVARYLDVAEFGDVALAMTVVLFTQLLSDAGLSRSLIRKEDYDPVEWNSVFWFLVMVGIALAGALLCIAPIWAAWFERPALAGLVSALAATPFLLSASAVPTARMERASRFPAIAAIRTLSSLAGFATAVILAKAGAGAWALIWQQIVIALVQAGGAFCMSGFRPLSPRKRLPLGEHAVFARDSLATSFLFVAQKQLPMMMIGYALGPAPLGLYSMSQRVLNLPLLGLANPMSQVAYVKMSRAQKDPARIGEIYVACVSLLALAICPPMATLAAVGDTAFTVLLSEPWRPVATIFALAAPGIALEASTASTGVLLQAINRTGIRFRMVLERTALRLVLVAAALPFGVEAVAFSITLSSLLFLPRVFGVVASAIGMNAASAYAALARPVLISAVLWAACSWIQANTTGWMTLLLAAACLAAVWSATGLATLGRLRRSIVAISA